MDLPLEKVSKITSASNYYNGDFFSCQPPRKGLKVDAFLFEICKYKVLEFIQSEDTWVPK